MKKEITEYIDKCLTYQKVKTEHQYLMGELWPLEISTWKRHSIAMDFVMDLSLSDSKKNAIWVIVNQLTKSAYFLPIRDIWGVEKVAQLYVKEIVRLHGIPVDTISDRDQRFQACVWQALQKAFRTKLNFSSSYHPKADGVNRKSESNSRGHAKSWHIGVPREMEGDLPLVEFSYNNRYLSTIKMALFVVLCGRKCRIQLCWDDLDEVLTIGPESI